MKAFNSKTDGILAENSIFSTTNASGSMGKTVKIGKGFKQTISGQSGLFTQTSWQIRHRSLANPDPNPNQTTSKILENVLSKKFTTSRETEDEAIR